MTVFFMFIKLACKIFTFAILLRAVLSWLPANPHNKVTAFLSQVTDPILNPTRRFIPRAHMLDLSPLVAILILQLIYIFVP